MSTIKSSAENLTLNADGANNDIKFQSNGSEVASIDQAGTITATTFTGAATDATKLPLAGGTMTGNLTVGSSSGGTILRITAANNNYAYLEMGDPDDVDVGRIVYSNINNRMQIYVNAAEKLRIHSSGIASFNDGITLGSGLDAVGANTLDDYEEGTFTPELKFGGATTGIGYSSRAGNYTKIGNRVIGNLSFILSSKGSATGSATITGLPLASTHYMTAYNYNDRFSAPNGGVNAYGSTNTQFALYEQRTDGTNNSLITNSNFNNTTFMMLAFTYQVA